MTQFSRCPSVSRLGRLWLWLALGGLAATGAGASSGCATEVEEPTLEDILGRGGAGNGAPSGAHFNLDMIGVPKDKTADMTGDNGRRMFVPRFGRTRINLSEGPFEVIDANATDGTGGFQLPNPDPDGDGVTSYSVFARALGKPGGSSTTTTCATDTSDGELVCSLESLVLVREGGKQTFDNVSRELLFVTADLDGDGTTETVSLFSDGLEDFFWDYDNDGLHLAQLRFYEVSTNINQ